MLLFCHFLSHLLFIILLFPLPLIQSDFSLSLSPPRGAFKWIFTKKVQKMIFSMKNEMKQLKMGKNCDTKVFSRSLPKGGGGGCVIFQIISLYPISIRHLITAVLFLPQEIMIMTPPTYRLLSWKICFEVKN